MARQSGFVIKSYIVYIYSTMYLKLERLLEMVFAQHQCCDKQTVHAQQLVVSRRHAGYHPFPSQHLRHSQYDAFPPPHQACDPTIAGHITHKSPIQQQNIQRLTCQPARQQHALLHDQLSIIIQGAKTTSSVRR